AAVHVGVVGPLFGAGGGVERDDLVEGRGEVEGAFDENGSGFEGGFVVEVGGGVECAGVVGPGDCEAGNVLRVDLLEERITGAAEVVAVGGPGGVGRGKVTGKQQYE